MGSQDEAIDTDEVLTHVDARQGHNKSFTYLLTYLIITRYVQYSAL